ncbi:helix-turn-helix domain-containing protein [Streptococcus mutans]|uniref:helix-turn-helix domain-containing protein n=1 Tax=Streptococcus mutans TaxID=1309 RepID=UPI0014558F69|nr:helix-turn-helix domain-containing protein [Streptococcus mutans]NLQ47920.1 helix-turn-helix domain-containing protein [Streptococcus mutans]
MFEVLKPDKKEVGLRLRQVKNELGLSFSEFGRRLGLKKPTINAYVRGDNLAPLEVLEKVSKLYGKPIDWFYYGEFTDYIANYIEKIGYGTFLKEHPNITQEIEKELFRLKNNPRHNVTQQGGLVLGSHEISWESETGYPNEGYLEDVFFELFEKTSKQEIRERAKNYLATHSNISEAILIESVDYIVNNIYNTYQLIKDPKNLTNETIDNEIKEISEEIVKREGQDDKSLIQYDDNFILGKLINILEDSQKTRQLLLNLSYELTNMPFSQFHEGYELVDVLQSLRPKLISLYNQTDYDDWSNWAEK